MLRLPAAAITSVSFPAIEVMVSTFSEFSDLNKFLLHGVVKQLGCTSLVPARFARSVVNSIHPRIL